MKNEERALAIHAKEANRLHAEIVRSVDSAIRVGELLTQIKAGLGHGAWLPWVKANLVFSERTARNYIWLFQNREAVKSATVADLSLSDAYRLLSEHSETQIKFADLKPNPFRDFAINPVDGETVTWLRQSIRTTGFWGGVVCREYNDQYQIAAGHCRVAAAIEEGIEYAENGALCICHLGDREMIIVPVVENTTQRANAPSAAALHGSVAAAYRYLTANGEDADAAAIERFFEGGNGYLTKAHVKEYLVTLRAAGCIPD